MKSALQRNAPEQREHGAEMAEYKGKFRLYRLSEFRNKLPAMRWFIKPLIPRYGITLLYGEPKEAGKKTFTGLSMACAIATGRDWCGFATTKGTVLYIGGEGFFGLLRRQAAWEKLHGVEANDLALFRVAVNFFEPLQVREALAALKAQGFQPDFVVIDTLARSMSGGKENATEDMTKVFELMDFFRARLVAELAQENWNDAGILIIHHTDKRGLEYRGSSVIKGTVDALIQAKADGPEITLISKGYKDAADFKTFTVGCESVTVETEDGPEGVLAVKGLIGVAPASAAAEKAAKKEEEDARKAEQNLILMVTVLREFLGNKATNADWLNAMQTHSKTGWSERSFTRRLNILKARGWVRIVGDGADGLGRTVEGALYEATELAPIVMAASAASEASSTSAEGASSGTNTTAEPPAANHGHQTTATTASPLKGGDGSGSRGSGLDDEAAPAPPANDCHGSGGSGSTKDGNGSDPVVSEGMNGSQSDIAKAVREQLERFNKGKSSAA
jgi:hypothetical protein